MTLLTQPLPCVGKNLSRPESVIATADVRLYATDRRCGVVRVLPTQSKQLADGSRGSRFSRRAGWDPVKSSISLKAAASFLTDSHSMPKEASGLRVSSAIA